MSQQTINLGREGEEIASRYLQRKGYRIIARNYKNRSGEIDIIAKDKQTFVFIEVKTRQSHRFGSPDESVTAKKQRQIIRVAAGYLLQHRLEDIPVRFDVIAILIRDARPVVNHIESAFEASSCI